MEAFIEYKKIRAGPGKALPIVIDCLFFQQLLGDDLTIGGHL